MILDLFSDYNPHPGQWRFRNSRARFRNLIAGRRYGKDFCGARGMSEKIFVEDYPRIAHLPAPPERFRKYAKPLLHYWCVAPNYDIGKIQMREIFSIFPREFQMDPQHFEYDANAHELRLLRGRILIEFKSADRPESLVAVGLDGVYVTEMARLKEGAWDANIRPTLTDKQGWGIFTSTPLPKQWYVDFVNLGDPRHEKYTPTHENFFGKTIENIRIPGIAEEVELARKTLPAKYFRREYEASMTFFEGQIYDEWSEDIHCPHPFPLQRYDIVVGGVDWGFANPGCILICGIIRTRYGNIYHFIDESYEAGLLVSGDGDCWIKRAKMLGAAHNVKIWYCDTEEPANIAAFRNAGLNAFGADKDVHDGIQAVATALHVSEVTNQPRMLVHRERCPNLTREILQYQWDKDEEPLKENDHSCDTARYIVKSHEKYGGQTQYLMEKEAPMRA